MTPEEAISGFANPATITVLAMLILAAGLTRTGVTLAAAQMIARVAGGSDARLLVAPRSASPAEYGFITVLSLF